MRPTLTDSSKRFVAAWMAFTVGALGVPEAAFASAGAGPQELGVVRYRVQELYASGSEVRVRLAEGTTVKGRITSVEADAFTLRENKTGQDVTLQYTRVTEIKGKRSLSGAAKAGLIVTGALLLIACAMPAPLTICHPGP